MSIPDAPRRGQPGPASPPEVNDAAVAAFLARFQLPSTAPWAWLTTSAVTEGPRLLRGVIGDHTDRFAVGRDTLPSIWTPYRWTAWGVPCRSGTPTPAGPYFVLNLPDVGPLPVLCLWQCVIIAPERVYVERVAGTNAAPAHDRSVYLHPHEPSIAEEAAVQRTLSWLRTWHRVLSGRPEGPSVHLTPEALRAAIDTATLKVWHRTKPRRPLQREVAVEVFPCRPEPKEERSSATVLSRRMSHELHLSWRQYIRGFSFPN
jgi:hypothetical protein